ncbi:hypothetical protein TeGR_g6990 [Tetraparma gracilis]|uniref:Uncharacterized protein n=1 Tax=Tetraparma gracilis TaxID=2962635 RepID=A0ABQ6N382_9STRA|nr:hypothetical protein TeGR_g6990 [Tetraparma gracilis]
MPPASLLPPAGSFSARLLGSPLSLNLSLTSFADLSSLATAHQSRWLSHLSSCAAIPARSRGAYNTRDDKLRQFYYRGQLDELVGEMGEELGRAKAACNTGPVSEAYVGGGS